jgi:hypothetical protein
MQSSFAAANSLRFITLVLTGSKQRHFLLNVIQQHA